MTRRGEWKRRSERGKLRVRTSATKAQPRLALATLTGVTSEAWIGGSA